MQFSFDATGIDTSDDRGFEPLPQGKYNAMVSKVEERLTQSGVNMLVLECTVMDGEFANRKIWWNFHLNNKSEQAVKISSENLYMLTINCDLPKPIGTFDALTLQGIPFVMGVKVIPQGEYPAKNEVTHTRRIQNQPPTAPMMGRPTPPPTATVATPPWS